MKRAAAVLLALLAAPVAASAQQAPPPPAVETAPLPPVALPPELDRVLRDYERAWRARDAGALAALFTEDGMVLQSGRPPVKGRDAVRRAYTGAGGDLSLRALAYATDGAVGYIIGGFARAEGEPDGGKFVLTLRREDGAWKIASDMDNPNQMPRRAPAPAAPPATP
ncbi:MAG TPA: nuclear transport factor 2 family protein [Longimicrobium sp.]|nr:nuclear transport factor 2 family protein [Longimicrobium sp.]